MKILVGCDPELFVFNPEGKPISAHTMCKGTKEKPEKVNRGAVQVDGLALEFNTDPAEAGEEFNKNIETVLAIMESYIPKGHSLQAVPVAEFGAEYMKTLPKAVLELGCDPDYNAYTGKPNKRPNGAVDFRTGSGHIHIGWTEGMDPHDPEHFEACQMLVKELDYTLGYTSMLWDKDAKRRTLYGAAGAFRPKPYGVEYRTLSNAWVRNPKLREWIFSTVQKTVDALENGNSLFNKFGFHAQGAIRNNAGLHNNANAFLKHIDQGLYGNIKAGGKLYVWE